MASTAGMSRRAFGGAVYIGIAQFAKIAATVISTIIVARILSPGDYGVIAMAAPVLGFILLFQDLGLSQATVQAPTLSDDQSNALFWLNIIASVAIAVALLAISPFVARFYDDYRTGQFVAASALTILITGTANQHAALLNRNLRFRALSVISITASITTLLATIAAAMVLRNFWALWIGAAAGMVVNSAMTWLSSSWRPSRPGSFRGSGDMIRFGGALTGFSLINFLCRNLDNVLVARVWGAGPVGLYDRSYKLMMFPIQNINAPAAKIMVPILSRLQDEPERYRRAFLLALRAILTLATPGIAVACATSDRLVPFLLGDRWAGATPIFFWLSLAAFVQPIGNATGWLFISSGRGKAMAQWGAVAGAVLITSFAVGVQWGAVGVAKAYFIGTVTMLPLLFLWCVKGTPIKSGDIYREVLLNTGLGGTCWIVSQVMEATAIPFYVILFLCLSISYGLSLAIFLSRPDGREYAAMFWAQGFAAIARNRRD